MTQANEEFGRLLFMAKRDALIMTDKSERADAEAAVRFLKRYSEPEAKGEAGAGPVRCSSCDGTGDLIRVDGEWIGWCPCGAAANAGAGPVGEVVAWRDMATAPRDGTLLMLLVRPYASEEDGPWTPFEDSADPQPTIGFNSLTNTEVDRWHFAGWDWSHDRIIEGDGEIIGWAPFARPVDEPGEVERLTRDVDFWKGRFPSDGSCIRCGSVPRNADGLCATCVDEGMPLQTEVDPEWVARASVSIAQMVNEWHFACSAPTHIPADLIARRLERFVPAAEAALAETRERLEKVGAAARPITEASIRSPSDEIDIPDNARGTISVQMGAIRALRAALSTQESSAALAGDGKGRAR